MEEFRENHVFLIFNVYICVLVILTCTVGCRIARRVVWCHFHRKWRSESRVMLEKQDFLVFIVKIGGKNRFFRIYARTNAKIKNRRKIISGKLKELSSELSATVWGLLVAEKIVNVTKNINGGGARRSRRSEKIMFF